MTVHRLQLTIYHLRFACEAQTLIHFGPQVGAQIRGALWESLQQFACTDRRAQSEPNHSAHCPMCRLMALETMTSGRGINPARPFAVQPPLTGSHFRSGERFTFGISLFGDVAELVPYVIQAVYRMGQVGIGYGRGQFILKQVISVNPFTQAQKHLLEDGRVMLANVLPVYDQHIVQAAATLPFSSMRLRFLTPAQIISDRKPDLRPVFAHLIARLLERCQSIEQNYSETAASPEIWRSLHLQFSEPTQSIRVVQDQTRWINIRSGSRRAGTSKTLSGFVGDAVFEGNLALFREWLLWGQSLHVGKNAVKGNGWYQVVM